LRTEELETSLEFLSAEDPGARALRISGPSGAGKSFLAREILVRASARRNALGIYVDVPAGELEGSALLSKIDDLLSAPRSPTRDAPSFVDRKISRSWQARKRGRSGRRLSYAYLVFRDLVAQIPLVGPFIKAVLPQSAPLRVPTTDSAVSLGFLMKASRSRPVWIVVDNTQFLPFALRETLATQFAGAGRQLRLILVERGDDPDAGWAPSVPDARTMEVVVGDASLEDVTALVQEVLPDAPDHQQIASTIFRRSSGNLKSVWYQLRLIASRRADQAGLPASYEDVITTLPTLDQAVLRFIVFTVGGLTVASLAALLHATDLRLQPEAVTDAINDLAALGLLVVNGENFDRVRVEHALIAQVVDETTPEEEKLELREQAVAALCAVLEAGPEPGDEAVLYDRLLGIVDGVELRRSPLVLALVVRFIQGQVELERHGYIASICRDSVCWDVLDELPDTTVRSMLDAVQKAALFDFGLILATRLRHAGRSRESLASLYEAKYLVQLFRYDEASVVLERVPESAEKRVVLFNVALNLAQDDDAAEIASAIYAEITERTGTEADYLVLRNSAHLFEPQDARALLEVSVAGFRSLGRRFATATAVNNLGIIELTTGAHGAARAHFEEARRELSRMGSSEVYQPLVNLSGLSLLEGDPRSAERFLDAAREAVPPSLLQDGAMLTSNSVAIEICAGRADPALASRMRATIEAARRTRDLRFLDIVVSFAEDLDAAFMEAPLEARSAQRSVDQIRKTGRVPIELFFPVTVRGTRLDVPFVLSPHWRY
jgi:tetratricopeptide (TPR) repeat protein